RRQASFFPRHCSRGSIEAKNSRWVCSPRYDFPRHCSRGSIEAMTGAITSCAIRSPFHGTAAVAPLKRGGTRAGARCRATFHGTAAVAPLKQPSAGFGSFLYVLSTALQPWLH